jgi:hypothetical protein
MAIVERITRDPPTQAAADYGHLYRTGLARVQQLAEKTWTDYNDHDPGVTILQLLCYALTDVAYRVEHPIEDILAPAPGVQEDAPPDAFYTGEQILTCDPLTSNDYRKLVYDRVGPMRNAWLHASSASGIKGLYDVRLQPWRPDNSEDQQDNNYLRSWTATLLRQFRNIGEDFDTVEVLKPLNVTLAAEIQVGFEDKPEDILANILFELGDKLIPFPRVVTIDTRFQQEIPADDIFVGPELQHGYIDDRHLEALPPAITLEKILSIIRNVASVLTIRDMTITTWTEDARSKRTTVPPKPVFLPRDHIPYLDIASSVDAVKLIRDGSVLGIDADSVQKSFDHLVRSRLDRELYARQRMRDMDYRKIPWGRHRDLQRYSSIQREFPVAYGLGSYGIPDLLMRTFADESQTRSRRETQVKQLKAYLLFFEQLLANQLSQLANVGRLFSLDKRLDRTYFWQAVTDPPGIACVLDWEGEGGEDQSEDTSRPSDGLDRYRRELARIIGRHDPLLDRRERVLDHLLARFNVRFDDDKLELLRREQALRRYSGDRDKARIRWKRRFLQEYVTLGRGRGAGIDYSVPAGYGIDIWDHDAGSPQDASARGRVMLRARHNISSKTLRSARLAQMLALGADSENYRSSSRGDGIELLDASGEVIAYAPGRMPPEAAAEAAIEAIAALMGRIRAMPEDARSAHIAFSDPVPSALERRVSLLAGYTSDLYLIEHVLLRPSGKAGEDQARWSPQSYSLTASMFFSVWRERFQRGQYRPFAQDTVGHDYRQFAENIVRENTPAHIAIRCYWLSKDDMSAFKTLYYDWRAAKAEVCRGVPEERSVREHMLEQVDVLAARLRLFVDRQRDAADRGEGLPGRAD